MPDTTDDDDKMTNLRIRFDPDDWRLLCDVSSTEKLTKTEVMRRALRAYAPVALREVKKRQQVVEQMLRDGDDQA